ncbi:hypothetical protein K7X08_030741 [Anisodus acutangulus]|uniref:non-specific serine/threonine protein kinase n=1 Tax=Anisodus acutangulus TaxID=402998 RepID=A0A9Q1M4K1_9SOLA|nr:hypothetical protein K7X08_030741 [Anisodus acutangulus]
MNQDLRYSYILIASLNLCVFSLILQIDKCSAIDSQYVGCYPISCRYGPRISFPFYIQDEQESYCGYPGFGLNCSEQGFPVVHIAENEYIVEHISYQEQIFKLKNSVFNGTTTSNGCVSEIKNMSLNNRPFKYVNDSRIYLLSKCNGSIPEPLLKHKIGLGFGCEENGNDFGLAIFGEDDNFEFALQVCKKHVVVPVEMLGNEQVIDYQVILRREFRLSWTASNCSECARSGGHCGFDIQNFQFKCFCTDRPHASSCKPTRKHKLGLILASVLGGAVLIILVVAFIVCRYKKKHKSCLYFSSRNKSSDPSLTHDFDGDSIYHGVSVFSYAELEEATSNFDSSRELGDGGFGAVYYGKLRDGREVAVKRLYEHNCKRMEQFKNEIEILTRLRHRNLVTLYGCTSKHSRELLLVYEYIPNGTIGDHLNGDRAKDGFLAWPVRMNIAVETACALAYLHASDIIHRDVKTSNILLDGNCCVKVADFGLSRLFPNDATHVSTAPQGTAGYVDPEYHESYQLTDKSDVYSFGVVLVELISSMPAVDITRCRHEINLASLAINRIQRCAFDELIDPSLGFKSDPQVMRMTTSVAELAFQCLQLETDLRPTMDEVLETLKHIQGAYTDHIKDEKTNDSIVDDGEKAPTYPKSDKVVLLKKMQLAPSPISVTEKWVSSCSSSNISG